MGFSLYCKMPEDRKAHELTRASLCNVCFLAVRAIAGTRAIRNKVKLKRSAVSAVIGHGSNEFKLLLLVLDAACLLHRFAPCRLLPNRHRTGSGIRPCGLDARFPEVSSLVPCRMCLPSR